LYVVDFIIDKNIIMCIITVVMLKQTERLTDPGSNPGCSTISTCCTKEYGGFKSSQQVFMMGQILDSTPTWLRKWSYR